MENQITQCNLTRKDYHRFLVDVNSIVRKHKKFLGENRSYSYHYWGHDLKVSVLGHNKAIVEDCHFKEKDQSLDYATYEVPVSKLSFTDDKSFYHSFRDYVKHHAKSSDNHKDGVHEIGSFMPMERLNFDLK